MEDETNLYQFDAFGTTIRHNLSNRGIGLLPSNEHPNLEVQYTFLSEKCESSNIKSTNE